jgi:hypothetical protein
MPTVYRGEVRIESGANPRYGIAKLEMPSGVLNIGGIAGQNQNINVIESEMQLSGTGAGSAIKIGTGTIANSFDINSLTLQHDTGDITLSASNSGGSGTIKIETTNQAAGNIIINTTATGPSAGAINITSSNLIPTESGIKLETDGGRITIGPNISGDVYIGNSTNTTFIGNNMQIEGNLLVKGLTTTINTQTLTVKDNIILLNAESSSGAAFVDSGIVSKRAQDENLLGEGVIVEGAAFESALTGDSSALALNEVQLAGTASSVSGFYNGYWIKFTSLNSNLVVKKIVSYDGLTRVAQVLTAFAAIVDLGSQYSIYNQKEYTGLIYREAELGWILASTSSDPSTTTNSSDYTTENLRVKNLVVDGEVTGSIVGFKTATVTINENNNGDNVIPGFTKTRGAARIMITGQSAGSATAIFDISKSVATDNGQVQRVTSSASGPGAELDVRWDSNASPVIFHSTIAANNPVTYDIVYIAL